MLFPTVFSVTHIFVAVDTCLSSHYQAMALFYGHHVTVISSMLLIFFYCEKKYCKYKKGLGNAHPAYGVSLQCGDIWYCISQEAELG
jgi:hypothetical protein